MSIAIIHKCFRQPVHLTAMALALAAAFSASQMLVGNPARADSTGRPLTVVELYTSLACATCPPAERILARLAERDDILALSFHVDYWDYAGWSDPYADASFSLRQQRYLQRLNIPYIITPQMVVDGNLQATGSDEELVERLIVQAVDQRAPYVAIEMTRTGEREVQVKLPAMEYSGQAEVVVVRFDARREIRPDGGDNRGRLLDSVNIVRQFKIHSLWKGEPITFDVPLEILGDDDLQYYAVIVQEPNQGHILGASYLDLRPNDG